MRRFTRNTGSGEYIVCIDEIGSGGAGQSKQTTSSTDVIGFELMPR